MPAYTRDQTIGPKNAIERVAIVGAGGTIGSHITSALLKTGRHTITALTRKNSTNKLPPGVLIAPIDYNKPSTLTTALQNQDILIITLSPTTPKDTHAKLVQAAAHAGIRYIIPNAYGADIENVKLGEETLLGPVGAAQRAQINDLGMHWIAVCTGFWYEYSLAGGAGRFGFDFSKRAVTFYDDGTTRTSSSTLGQVGRAVAGVLSLPVRPTPGADDGLTLADFVNKPLYVKSFVLSQRDMFESVKRVTGTGDADWSISYEDSEKRYVDGLALVKKGDMGGFSKLLYARVFSPDDCTDFSGKAQNEMLGLPEEDLDEATRAGIELVEELKGRAERMAN
ncbi:aromatic alcohol reductase [Aspergillus mulundensis]|uniref:Putative Oxidoreductase CipA n=1 Tax=Aspergillus mulundensis TaxID=1810919 RepID=A0A3D8SL20_9EURO|nr:putative Oxidoreductase CipA [Aspergillus mulundensis]RDW87003.1 putative Oxidoreductase CipA [Aspergillus mulundensis]